MVMRKLRTKMKLFLWAAVIIFVGFIFLEWGMQFTGTRRLSPRERGIIGFVNDVPLSYRAYSGLIEQYRKQGIPLWECKNIAFNTLVEEALIGQVLEEKGIEITDEEVVELIRNNPPPELLEDTFFQTDGKFDYNKYLAIIADPANIGWLQSYETLIRTQLPRQILYNIVTSTIRPTTMDILSAYAEERTKLKIEYAEIQESEVGLDRGNLKETELLEYYNAHKDEFLQTKANLKLHLFEYVVFPVSIYTEDEVDAKDLAQQIFDLAKDGASLDSLAREYACEIHEHETRTTKESLQGPIKEGDGYRIIKDDKELFLPIRPSDESSARVEERAMSFMEACKSSGWDRAVEAYELEVKTAIKTPVKIDLSYIDLTQKDKIIGPIEGLNCFYVLHTTGKQEPEFPLILDEVQNKYLRSIIRERAQKLLQEIKNKDFKSALQDKGIEVRTTELSIEDTTELGREFFIKSLNIPKDETAVIETDGGVYLAHCLDRQEPAKEEMERELPEFNARWWAEEKDRFYSEWLNDLKTNATIKDYRYNIY